MGANAHDASAIDQGDYCRVGGGFGTSSCKGECSGVV